MIKITDLAIINPENIGKETEINYIDIGSVGSGRILEIKNLKSDFPSRAKRKIIKGDIIISTVRPNLKTYALVDFDIDNLVCSTGFVVIRPKDTKYRDILYYFLTSNKAFSFYEKNCEGGNYPAFKSSILNDFEINEIESINKCLSVLTKQKNMINKTKVILKKIEIRNQYYADKLLSGELTVENNFLTKSANIDYNKSINITDHVHIINGYPFKTNEMDASGDYAIIKMSNFKEGEVSTLRNTIYTDTYIEKVKLLKNDLLIGLSGSVGEHAIFNLNETCLLNQRCIIIRNKDEIGDYVKTYIINKELGKLKNSGEGGVIKNVSSNYFQDMEIYLPKNHKEIMSFISKMNLEKYNIEKLLKLEKQRFEWLSDRLLSGEYIIED